MPPKRPRAGSSEPDDQEENMAKRTKRAEEVSQSQKPQDKSPNSIYETPGIVATFQAAAKADRYTPLNRLEAALNDPLSSFNRTSSGQSKAVVYWMRMQDMRIVDNRALSAASQNAKQAQLPLIVIFAFSPGDYKAHDRSPRRIDFMLRNLRIMKAKLNEMHIPLHTFTHMARKTMPERITEMLRSWGAGQLYMNIEYEVDELRRDEAMFQPARAARIRCHFMHDRCLVEPGGVLTKLRKTPTVYSPWLKTWTSVIRGRPPCLEEAPGITPNGSDIRNHETFGPLFDTEIPDIIPGFECSDVEQMELLWPAGTDMAVQILDRFLATKVRKSQLADKSPLEPGEEQTTNKASRAGQYASQRDRVDMDSTSRLSPYLAAGVISARQCIRRLMELQGMKTFDTEGKTGPSVWLKELGWRDFYTHILAAYPRVSMGRPYQEKYADVFWEEDVDGRMLQGWKDGKTGFPIVDAAMRQMLTQGYMHNRARMIAAMFLVKDLMLDWRLGERHFMQNFIDGDLGSNDGGWQRCASTGTDATPYFRIFNPLLQSEKADPNGDYIRQFVPELAHLTGKAIHDPFNHLPRAEFEALGYPQPIVDHKFARERAIRRFKAVGAQ